VAGYQRTEPRQCRLAHTIPKSKEIKTGHKFKKQSGLPLDSIHYFASKRTRASLTFPQLVATQSTNPCIGLSKLRPRGVNSYSTLGGTEIILILAVALLLFGGKKLPELAKGLGQGIREFKKATKAVTDEVQNSAEEKPAQPAQTVSQSPNPSKA
jgi:sec-independent protein translocase protein TatA